ncbi:hypothetical protein [endosymbiont of Lamellibrachia barhami]|uniref:hypothetical protein n=1 Tax=endosymbiont of Lamellibrachia barhami TaxID=205975 RepID=UPI001FEB9956|nr:hypothetical protein [endosymbiont of Lamellibrachia barhami]
MKKLIIALSLAGLCALPVTGQAAKYKEVSVSNGGTITGKVSFAGKDKAPKRTMMSAAQVPVRSTPSGSITAH